MGKVKKKSVVSDDGTKTETKKVSIPYGKGKDIIVANTLMERLMYQFPMGKVK